jgi:hypothetical protein
MQQTFGQAVASLVRETQPGDGIEGVALLRSASAVTASNYRNALGASRFGDAAPGLELHVEETVQPVIENLLSHWEQVLIGRGVPDIDEGRQRPVRAAPTGVHMRFSNEAPVSTGEQCFRARRVSDLLLKVFDIPRMRIFPNDANHHFPANRRLVAMQERVD